MRERERQRERQRQREKCLEREGERNGGERKWRRSFEKIAWVDLTVGLNQHLGVCLINS
jgi:hypothetical protein